AGWLRSRERDRSAIAKAAKAVSFLVVVQILFGAATLLSLGPIIMQLGHLFLADLLWIALVLLIASSVSKDVTAST
ncbi:MAG: cytochrome oxidase assembly protein, partial [Blastocatellia bacterium]